MISNIYLLLTNHDKPKTCIYTFNVNLGIRQSASNLKVPTLDIEIKRSRPHNIYKILSDISKVKGCTQKTFVSR